jgi:hypothetical protein
MVKLSCKILSDVGTVCNLCCQSVEALSSHLETDHVGSGKGSYTCQWENCIREKQPFTQRQKAIRHIRTHTGLKAYKVLTFLSSVNTSVRLVENVSPLRRFCVNTRDYIRNPARTLALYVINDSPLHQRY